MLLPILRTVVQNNATFDEMRHNREQVSSHFECRALDVSREDFSKAPSC